MRKTTNHTNSILLCEKENTEKSGISFIRTRILTSTTKKSQSGWWKWEQLKEQSKVSPCWFKSSFIKICFPQSNCSSAILMSEYKLFLSSNNLSKKNFDYVKQRSLMNQLLPKLKCKWCSPENPLKKSVFPFDKVPIWHVIESFMKINKSHCESW